jgi:hypothetical protein
VAIADLTAIAGMCIFLITATTGVVVLLALSPSNERRDFSKVTELRTLRRFANFDKVVTCSSVALCIVIHRYPTTGLPDGRI